MSLDNSVRSIVKPSVIIRVSLDKVIWKYRPAPARSAEHEEASVIVGSQFPERNGIP